MVLVLNLLLLITLDRRARCLAQAGFAAFGKGVQLISGSRYSATEPPFLAHLAQRLMSNLKEGKAIPTLRHSAGTF